MSAKRMNYKAKWLAAIKESQPTPLELCDVVEEKAQVIDGTTVSAISELTKLQQVLVQAANQGVSLCEIMNECSDVGFAKFANLEHMIDGKISRMPSQVIVRRVRDIMKMAEERIGVLSAICDNHADAMNKVTFRVETLEIANRKLQEALMGSLIIGKNPSRSDIEEYLSEPMKYRRNSEYEDLDADFSLLITDDRESESDNESAHSDNAPDEYESDDPRSHKAKAVVKHNRIDSAYEDEIQRL
jgi:hypothetical protein